MRSFIKPSLLPREKISVKGVLKKNQMSLGGIGREAVSLGCQSDTLSAEFVRELGFWSSNDVIFGRPL